MHPFAWSHSLGFKDFTTTTKNPSPKKGRANKPAVPPLFPDFVGTLVEDVNTSAPLITEGGPGRVYLSPCKLYSFVPRQVQDDRTQAKRDVRSTAQEGYSVGFCPPAFTIPGSLRASARLLVSVNAV